MSFCDCGDMPEFSRRDVRTAAKPHTCCECRRTIGAGEVYEVAVGRWEGTMLTFKTCDDCLDLRQAYVEAGYCHTYEQLWADHLGRLVDEGVAADHPARILALAKIAEIARRDEARMAEIRATMAAERAPA